MVEFLLIVVKHEDDTYEGNGKITIHFVTFVKQATLKWVHFLKDLSLRQSIDVIILLDLDQDEPEISEIKFNTTMQVWVNSIDARLTIGSHHSCSTCQECKKVRPI